MQSISNPEFDPDKVRTASSAAEGLCKWIRAMEVYDRVAKVKCVSLQYLWLQFDIQVVAPKKEKLAIAQKSLQETMEILNAKRAELKEVLGPTSNCTVHHTL